MDNNSSSKEKEQISKCLDVFQSYCTVFGGEDGKKVFKDLMKKFFFLDTTYEDNVYSVMYKEGQRSVILSIMNTIGMDIDVYKKMLDDLNKERIDEVYDFRG